MAHVMTIGVHNFILPGKYDWYNNMVCVHNYRCAMSMFLYLWSLYYHKIHVLCSIEKSDVIIESLITRTPHD